jgi:two-component system NtrC family response regulator
MEFAHKGTLFLDEIGELGLSMQVKILRFLQDKIIERVGGREPISIDARIIAATNRDLEKEVQAGRFREDLFYRINGVRISLPPLRERDTDILLLANHLFGRFATQAKKRLKGFSASAHEAMLHHTWPGNVREVENRIRRGVIMAEGEYILPSDLELEEPKEISQNISLRDARDNIDREMITKALTKNHGNIKDAARDLGITRQTLYDLIEKHSIQT